MKDTEQVKNALGLLRDADAGREASPFLETRPQAAFREKHAPAAVKHAPWWTAWRMWGGVAVAGLVVGAVVYRAALPGAVEAPAANRPAPVAAAADKPAAPKPVPPLAVAQAPKQGAATPRRSPKPVRAQPVEAYSASSRSGDEFLAIPYAPPMTSQDRGEVIRVRIPRQSLRQFGIPVDPARLTERVPADLLVGEDGIPRGIRFVRTSEPR